MKKKALLGIGVLVLGMVSCTSSQTVLDTRKATSQKISDNLNNTSWVLQRLDMENRDFVPTEEQKELVLTFADGNYGSSDGCNGKGGEYTTEDNKITFKLGMSTMRYCGDEMKHLIYSVPFSDTKFLKIEKNKLKLFNGQDKVIATYIKKDAE